MEPSPEFSAVMRELFRFMKIDMAEEEENQVYSVTIDSKIIMNFFELPSGFLNIITEIGRLPEKEDEKLLLELMNFNCFTPLYPQFNFKVGADRTLRKVELWVRSELADAERFSIADIFQSTLDMADMLANILDPANQQGIKKARQARSTAARLGAISKFSGKST
jgi:hypothetical protein